MFDHTPQTRGSLLLRLKDAENQRAWGEFVEIYRPMVYRFARGRGFQDADAQDLVQRVLMSVSRKVGDWEGEAGHGRFRAWLFRITRNAIIDNLRLNQPDKAAGGSGVMQQLLNQKQASDDIESAIESEYRRELFRAAARHVRDEFEYATWRAFWMTTVEGESVAEVAKTLGRSVGAVYTARSRVMKRLQDAVTLLDEDDNNHQESRRIRENSDPTN